MKNKWVIEKRAKDWIARAISNLELAKAPADSKKVFFEDRCYLCSRSVEYSIKTLMILKLGKYKQSHKLDELIYELERSGIIIPDEIKNAALLEYSYEKSFFPFKFPFSFNAKSSLTKNTLETRYPDDFSPITKKGYEQALQKAEIVVSWVNQQYENRDE